MASPGYILRSPHTLSLPGAKAKLHRALNESGRGINVVRFGSSPTQPVTDQQYSASADAPGASHYAHIDELQCALNHNLRGIVAPLVIDGRWGPRTSTALVTFVRMLHEVPPAPPASVSDYHYVTPAAGATVIQITNALADALVADTDVSQCVADAATGRTPGVVPSAATGYSTHAPTQLAPPPPGAATTTDWTVWGIVAAGVTAVGVVGYAVMKRGRKHKKGRR